jgi:pilus assembly protein Flp/PilA
MLKLYAKGRDLLERLPEDRDGVVSFEYLIVAALIIGAVGLAYGAGGATISAALSTGFTDVTTAFSNAI